MASLRLGGVVVAAGRGERLRSSVPKQFERIGGTSLVERAVRALVSFAEVDGVVVVLPAAEIGGARHDAALALPGVIDVVAGGATRADSVLLGVARVGDLPFVLVHDAARPFATAALVAAVARATVEHGAAVPVIEVPDTVKADDGGGWAARTLDRSRLRLAQTPQGSRTDWLVEALHAAKRDGIEVTDEAAALERAGRRVRFVPGETGNVKITTAEDLARARRLAGGGPGLRVGIGFDVHRFGPDPPLVLGGVRFPGEPGLLGHSDADVVLHAAMDALLGAASLGDIGAHFPPGDPQWKGAASTELARRVASLVEAAGFAVSNVDVTVLAERPRIRERVGEMREAIAGCLGIPSERVGIQATTLESLGALGRGEGIACQAVALLFRVAGEP